MTTMTNRDVSQILLQMGDLMEFLGENTFRTRSYWRAAELVRLLDEPLTEIADRGELHRLRGVGELIEDEIGEILASGTCGTYEELKKGVPAEVREIISRSGLTPRLVRAVVRYLDVKNPSSLASAVAYADLEAIPELNQGDRAQILRAAFAGEKPEPAAATAGA